MLTGDSAIRRAVKSILCFSFSSMTEAVLSTEETVTDNVLRFYHRSVAIARLARESAVVC